MTIIQAQNPSLGASGRIPPLPGPTTNPKPKLQVFLEDFHTTSGKAIDWPHYHRRFIVAATANGHEDVLSSNYVVPVICRQMAYLKYQMMNDMVFSSLDYGTAHSILRSKVNKHRATKDGRAAVLELDQYQKGQGGEETCATNAWERLTALYLTPTFPGGVEAFLANWDDAISDLTEVNQVPNEFMEKTLLKERIADPAYGAVLTNLDMMTPAPTIDICKAEIRRAGAKLENKRKSRAKRSARMTQQDSYMDEHSSWEYEQPPQPEDDDIAWLIAAMKAR